MNIAIIGLGRLGSEFLARMVEARERGVEILAVAEEGETAGKEMAQKHNIAIKADVEIAQMGPQLDVIFDMTGSREVRSKLRNVLNETENQHTVIAPETVSYLISTILGDHTLPDVHDHKGY